jgi:hypothetical protein
MFAHPTGAAQPDDQSRGVRRTSVCYTVLRRFPRTRRVDRGADQPRARCSSRRRPAACDLQHPRLGQADRELPGAADRRQLPKPIPTLLGDPLNGSPPIPRPACGERVKNVSDGRANLSDQENPISPSTTCSTPSSGIDKVTRGLSRALSATREPMRLAGQYLYYSVQMAKSEKNFVGM